MLCVTRKQRVRTESVHAICMAVSVVAYQGHIHYHWTVHKLTLACTCQVSSYHGHPVVVV